MRQQELDARLLRAIEKRKIENKKVDEIVNLIRSGANVNAKYKEDGSPLHLASHLGDDRTIETLIELRADVNARNDDGRTPLHLASQPGHTSAITTLIGFGADVNARDGQGNTPFTSPLISPLNQAKL